MKYRRIGLAAALLVMATLACSLFEGEKTSEPPPPPPPPTQAPSPTQPPPPPTQPPPPPTQPPPPPTQPSGGGTTTLTLYNQSDVAVCYVYLSPTTSDQWGEDWLGASEVIDSGGSRVFRVAMGAYDLRADDCDGNTLDTQWNVDLSGPVDWTVSGGGAPSSGAGLDYTLEPNFGSVSLSAGFMPDPQTVELVSGGYVDVAAQGLGGECGGYATSAPDFRIQWSGSSSGLRIFFVADGGGDTTLIVNDANGAWHCNDDSPYGGLDPLVDIPSPPQGQYDIWVGSFEAGEFVEGTLYITERDIYPGNLSGE